MTQNKVIVSEEGLQTLREGGPSLLMRWDEVYAVSFSKVDAITSVITYLTFDYDWGEYVEITDNAAGFEQLVSDLPNYLQTVPPGWQKAMQAASPSDAPVTIYQRLDS